MCPLYLIISFKQVDSEILQKQAHMSKTGGRWLEVNPRHLRCIDVNFSRLHFHYAIGGEIDWIINV